MIRKINYKSDFDFILHLTTANGVDIGFPDYDWTAQFTTTNSTTPFHASCKDGKCLNCFNDNGLIHVVVDSHKLGTGKLKVNFKASIPNGIYPDGFQHIVTPRSLDIELVRDASDGGEDMDATASLPYIKGNPFTYSDFTEEQIAELQRPATEAAQRANQATSDAQTATRNALSATEEANQATTDMHVLEATVIDHEQKRMEAEIARQTQFATAQNNAETATSSANEAASKVQQIADKYADTLNSKQDKITTTEDLLLSEDANLSLTDTAKQRLFDDLWTQAVGTYGKVDHSHVDEDGVERHYYLNELWLNYKEAVITMQHPLTFPNPNHLGAGVKTNILFSNIDAEYDAAPISALYMFSNCTNLEILRISTNETYGFRPTEIAYHCFKNCVRLRKIIGVINLGNITYSPFNFAYNCRSLEEIKIKSLKHSINFLNSPHLNLESIQYMIINAANTSAITVTVHPDVYAKLTDESNTEWYQVLFAGAEKNIQFATV